MLAALRWLVLLPVGLWLLGAAVPSLLIDPNFYGSGEVGDPVYTRGEMFRYAFHLLVLGGLLILPPRLWFRRSAWLVGVVVALLVWELALQVAVPALQNAVRLAIVGSAALLLLFVVLRSEQRAAAALRT